jgi:hypothetical protein
MRWLDQRRRLRDEKNKQRDAKEKKALRPRIAEAVHSVVPPAETVRIEAIGRARCSPFDPSGPSMRLRDRLAAVWHNVRGYRSYIVLTNEHLIVLRRRRPGGHVVTLPRRSIEGATCEHVDRSSTPFVPGTIEEHFRIYVRASDHMEIRLKLDRPWLTEAADLCEDLRAPPIMR